MASQIHETAIIDPKAKIGTDVEIGPYCVVGPHVELGDKVRLISHVVIDGHTKIGAETTVYPFASLGQIPQDLKFHGEESFLEIGEKNTIREYVTMSPGTEANNGLTKVGSNGLFMINVHIAHDCVVGNNVIMSNNATLAGHVIVGDFVVIGGLAAVHQFVRIGSYAMIGGMSALGSDVIPYGMVTGEHAHLAGLNVIGMERHGFKRDDIHALRSAYRLLFSAEGTMAERLEDVAQHFQEQQLVENMVSFVRSRTSRALCQPKREF